MSFARYKNNNKNSHGIGTAAKASTSQQMINADVKREPDDLNSTQAFCLRWNNYQMNMVNVFDQIFHDEKYVDVTLVCEGTFIKAHKIVLSACSPYFQQIFDTVATPHPVIVLKDMLLSELKPILDFMYKGEIYVAKEQIGILLRVAESLKVRGLAEVAEENVTNDTDSLINEEEVVESVGERSATVTATAETATNNSRHASKRKLRAASSDSLILCETNDDIEPSPVKQTRSQARKQIHIIPDEAVETEFDTTADSENDYDVYPVDLDEYRDDSMSETSRAEKFLHVHIDEGSVVSMASYLSHGDQQLIKTIPNEASHDKAFINKIISFTVSGAELIRMSPKDAVNWFADSPILAMIRAMYEDRKVSTYWVDSNTCPSDNCDTDDCKPKLIKKGTKVKAPSWTPAQLKEAISSVVHQKMRFTQASSLFNIPKGTLYDNILGKSNRMEVLARSGLNAVDENAVLEFCCDLTVSPYNRRTRKPLRDVLAFVFQMPNCRRDVFDASGKFAYRWWWAFCKKYSIVSLHYDNNANVHS